MHKGPPLSSARSLQRHASARGHGVSSSFPQEPTASSVRRAGNRPALDDDPTGPDECRPSVGGLTSPHPATSRGDSRSAADNHLGLRLTVRDSGLRRYPHSKGRLAIRTSAHRPRARLPRTRCRSPTFSSTNRGGQRQRAFVRYGAARHRIILSHTSPLTASICRTGFDDGPSETHVDELHRTFSWCCTTSTARPARRRSHPRIKGCVHCQSADTYLRADCCATYDVKFLCGGCRQRSLSAVAERGSNISERAANARRELSTRGTPQAALRERRIGVHARDELSPSACCCRREMVEPHLQQSDNPLRALVFAGLPAAHPVQRVVAGDLVYGFGGRARSRRCYP